MLLWLEGSGRSPLGGGPDPETQSRYAEEVGKGREQKEVCSVAGGTGERGARDRTKEEGRCHVRNSALVLQ